MRWQNCIEKVQDSSSHQSAHTPIAHQIWSWTPKMLNPNLLSINFTQEPFKLNHFEYTLYFIFKCWNVGLQIKCTDYSNYCRNINNYDMRKGTKMSCFVMIFPKCWHTWVFFRNTFYVRSGSSPSPVLRCSKTENLDVRKSGWLITWERKVCIEFMSKRMMGGKCLE